jgi:hypothetical protein
MYRIHGVVAVVSWCVVSFGTCRQSLASLSRLTNRAFPTQTSGPGELPRFQSASCAFITLVALFSMLIPMRLLIHSARKERFKVPNQV